jgi:hypothetical protein
MSREYTDLKDILSIYDMEYGVTPTLAVMEKMFKVLRDWSEVMLVKGENGTWVCRASNPTTGDEALASDDDPEEAVYKVIWHAWNIDTERRNSGTEGENGPAAPAPR